MKYLLIENEEGQYIEIDGTERYDILECHEAIGPRADEFKEFDNIEQAMEAYGVEEYHEPVIEEEVVISNEENTTEEQGEVE